MDSPGEKRAIKMKNTILFWLLILIFIMTVKATPLLAGDWEMFRHDPTHTGVSPDTGISLPLSLEAKCKLNGRLSSS
ncbi:MAG: hypothetical protein AAB110_00550, partial [Candidatus Desantisbacteria bacterium]